jgi:MFS family permease
MTNEKGATAGHGLIKLMTFLMFMTFAMTTDAVGVIIPEIIRTYGLDLKAAGAFHYSTMSGIALSALFLGFLADSLGRKATIVLGLAVFAGSALAFGVTQEFPVFVGLLFVSAGGRDRVEMALRDRRRPLPGADGRGPGGALSNRAAGERKGDRQGAGRRGPRSASPRFQLGDHALCGR